MRIFLPLPGNEDMAAALADREAGELGQIETRHFPDGESYVRVLSDVAGKDVDLVCTLANPDPQFLPLIFAANTARELGANRVGLIAPYLAYMRQDKKFHEGESVSSIHFAKLLSAAFDNLVTIDPHLHRISDLSEIFSIPTRTAHADTLLADWISKNVKNPIIVGPDSESEQWVSAAANRIDVPYIILSKERLGDRKVEITIPDIHLCRGRRPVLIDDVISSGRTMIEAVEKFRDLGFAKPVCVTVHGIFADDSYQQLLNNCEEVVSTDAIPHQSSKISVASLLV
jgi:ribose-phosphate pyrophosphokinase